MGAARTFPGPWEKSQDQGSGEWSRRLSSQAGLREEVGPERLGPFGKVKFRGAQPWGSHKGWEAGGHPRYQMRLCWVPAGLLGDTYHSGNYIINGIMSCFTCTALGRM